MQSRYSTSDSERCFSIHGRGVRIFGYSSVFIKHTCILCKCDQEGRPHYTNCKRTFRRVVWLAAGMGLMQHSKTPEETGGHEIAIACYRCRDICLLLQPFAVQIRNHNILLVADAADAGRSRVNVHCSCVALPGPVNQD